MAAILSDFLPYIFTDVQDCPIPIINLHLRSALIEFCNKSRLWKVDFELNLLDGKNEYTLISPESETTVIDVASLRVKNGINSTQYTPVGNDEQYHGTSESELNWKNPQWRDQTTENGSISDWFFRDGVLTITPTPAHGAANDPNFVDWMRGRMVLQPTRVATEYPDILFTEYAEEIAAGAKSKIMSMPRRGWTDSGQAAMHHVLFKRGWKKAWWKYNIGDGVPQPFPRRLGT